MPKKEIRVIGIDDAPFDKFKDREVLVITTVFRGGQFLDGVLSTKCEVDGTDATEKIVTLVNGSKFKPQLRCIFLDGIAFGGFNVIDIWQLHKKTKIPVIVVMRKMPNIKKINTILHTLGKPKEKRLILNAGPIHPANKIFIQLAGISIEKAKSILMVSCTRSNIPEALRISHIIASGIVLGESRGNA